MLDLAELEAQTTEALAELQRLCDGKKFTMCIPPQGIDSDVVLHRPLAAVPALIQRVRELEAERERIFPLLAEIHEKLDEQKAKLNLLQMIQGGHDDS